MRLRGASSAATNAAAPHAACRAPVACRRRVPRTPPERAGVSRPAQQARRPANSSRPRAPPQRTRLPRAPAHRPQQPGTQWPTGNWQSGRESAKPQKTAATATRLAGRRSVRAVTPQLARQPCPTSRRASRVARRQGRSRCAVPQGRGSLDLPCSLPMIPGRGARQRTARLRRRPTSSLGIPAAPGKVCPSAPAGHLSHR